MSWVKEPIGPVIDGKLRTSSETFDVDNPLTGEVLFKCSKSNLEDCNDAINSAQRTFQTWSKCPPSKKRLILLKAADILESKLEAAVELMAQEISATRSWATTNVMQGANTLREVAALATHVKGEIVPADRPGTKIMIYREPAGIVYSMCPWNAPIQLSIRGIATPLLCGNTVLLKPSEYTPKAQKMVVDVLIEAGLPAGAISYLPMAPPDAPALTEYIISQKEVRRVTFTGSDRVGRAIAQVCAKYLKQSVLELGCNAPVVVLDDSNLDDAVNAIVFGAFTNSGQICMSTNRVIVLNNVADELVKRLVKRTSSILATNCLEDKDSKMSGLFSKASVTRLMNLISDARSKGASLALGDMSSKGTIMQPHIVDHVDNTMDIFYQEAFGPLVCVTRVESIEKAIEATNDTDFTLCASVFSKDVMLAMDVARQIRSGSSHINGPTLYIEATLPNGGVGGSSGYGRFGGVHGIDEFVDKRNLTIQDAGAVYPL
uniref:ARAD1D27940p n=1 Tax=Blastobotrys adeninivorans TaxID=409370 RepID=A0A060TAM0_BLAAD